ncbi:hypothetical protein LMG28688_01155 [Paraburkholderia caffeinitolerans]|uniref:Lipoprotein n=1 Tax=Paraburkholderia caffeinitolerans TaxID=1723730 RepID=A0A6J5FLW3_9BURK|nr:MULTISPECIES: DUF859 domain-containing protein [Paraburkholderia]CAB3780976.1 hypothetical protein LMG28688_01155 [Paraburkholderia caffeinitolerans]
MKRILPILFCAALAACAPRGQVNPDVMQIATAPLTCSDKPQCDIWWQRAQDWVRDHSKYEVQTVTDTLIQTAGPGGGKRALAYEITRTHNSDGTTTIGFAAHCDSSLGCKPDPWAAGAAFKQYVRTGIEQPIQGTGNDADNPDAEAADTGAASSVGARAANEAK